MERIQIDEYLGSVKYEPGDDIPEIIDKPHKLIEITKDIFISVSKVYGKAWRYSWEDGHYTQDYTYDIYGVIDSNNNILIRQEYINIYFNKLNDFICKKIETNTIHIYHLQNTKCLRVTDYLKIEEFSEDFAVAGIIPNNESERKIKYGFINTNYDIVISLRFDTADKFIGNYAIVKEGHLYGIIDKAGKYKIPPIYESIYFDGNLYNILKNRESNYNVMGYFDRNLNMVLDFEFDLFHDSAYEEITEYYERDGYPYSVDRKISHDVSWQHLDGLKRVKKKGKIGFIDTNGNFIIDCNYDNFLDDIYDVYEWKFKEGLLCIRRDEKYGFLNEDFMEVINCQFDSVEGFYNGVAIVVYKNQYGAITKDGKYLVKPEFIDSERSGNKILFKNVEGLWGAFDEQGQKVIPFIFESSDVLASKIKDSFDI